MRNYFFCLFAFCYIAHTSVAQQIKLSPHTKHVLAHSPSVAAGSLLYMHKSQAYIGALIKVDHAQTAHAELTKIGAVIGTKAGSVWTIRIPVTSLSLISNLQGIAYLQLDEPVKPHMSAARATTRTDSVHAGINLPTRYSGKDVVLGVIDFGFDYNHPAFLDTSGSRIRVRKVWEQGGTGIPPQGYTYGRELSDTQSIKAATTDNAKQTHGTNVAGVAAGSGIGTQQGGRRHRGIAYDAEMVFVCVRRDSIESQWKEGGFSDFVDAVAYIFNYAASVQKPCIINVSWGSQSGPHNGTTLFNEAIDNLTGPGRIVALSAGNDGEDAIHLSKTFSPSDSVLHTFLSFTTNTYKRTWVDVWGEKNESFCLKVALYRADSVTASSERICTNNQFITIPLINAAGDTCEVEISSSAAEYNDQPRITADVFNRTADSVLISITGTSGTIHTWNEYYYYGYDKGYKSEYTGFNKPWAASGNTETTVSDMGSGKHVLLIGAYASKTSFQNLNGDWLGYASYVQEGDITPFSSRGPLTDGRIKPDIAAPGLTLASPCSSFDQDYVPGGARANMLVNSYVSPVNGKTYYYSEFIGTSASAPVASGIVALMLQANPGLFPFHVRNVLSETAIEDANTGNVPSTGNATWGFGKINAYGAVQGAINLVGLRSVSPLESDMLLYPNPFQSGVLHLQLNAQTSQTCVVTFTDLSGKVVHSESVNVTNGSNTYQLTLPEYLTGMLLIHVNGTTIHAISKLLIQ